MFLPPNCSIEIIQKYLDNKNNYTKKQDIDEITKMNNLKNLIDEFHKNCKGISISGMIYYSGLINEYSKLKEKYKEADEWDII